MPLKSLEELEKGRFYGINLPKAPYHHHKIVQFIELEDKPGTESVRALVLDKSSGVDFNLRFGKATSFMTPEETEEILYHCSYCGEAGHNRRTCPVALANGDSYSPKGKVGEVKYTRGDLLSPEDICAGDMVFVDHAASPGGYKEYSASAYEVVNAPGRGGKNVMCKTLEDIPGVGSKGTSLNFYSTTWNFYEAVAVDSSPKKKPIPLWELIETVLPASRLTLLYGPPGTGKTTIANSFGEPRFVSNITVTEETPAAELRGHFVPKGNEFVWMNGPALTEFTRGGRLVINEIDKASGDALTFCHALLDDPGIARITLPYEDEDGNPVTVLPHPDFHVVATMNGEPEDLPEALRDRFAVRLMVDQVHPNAIHALPPDLRKAAKQGIAKDGERSVSIRGWNAFVQLREMIGEENAARAVFGPRAQTILNTIKIDSLATK